MSPWALVSVVSLLAVFAALSWWLRRLAGPGGPDDAIKLCAQRRLDATSSVSVIEVDGQRFLVGSGRDGVRLLSALPRSPEAP